MNLSLKLSFVVLFLSLTCFGQSNPSSKQAAAEKPEIIAIDDAHLTLAKATITAHGGEKFKKMKSFIVRGTVDVTGPFSQIIPATFAIIIAGERYSFEVNNPIQPLKQIFDGKQKHSSGYDLPPVTSLGFPLLAKAGDAGYVIAALADGKKNRRGFRITTPDGFYTDFTVDEKSGRIKSYESSYDVDGRIVTTSVEIDEFQTVDGIIVPQKYSQRFDLGQMTAYANFNTKQILVNSTVGDEVFAMPK